ncbi:MAG: cysteine-rich CWC family protein [Halioglobus sp.]|nr:cysteine-rich CWC family protein [Halioglobus sp.]
MERATTAVETNATARRCPLCGVDNGCTVAAGHAARSCWCVQATIDPQALSRLPPDVAGRRCLCPACGRLQGEVSLER